MIIMDHDPWTRKNEQEKENMKWNKKNYAKKQTKIT